MLFTVAHKLPQDEAMLRVRNWLQSKENENVNVKTSRFEVDNAAHVITLALKAYSYDVSATITVSPTSVEIKTSEAQDFVEALSMWYEQLAIESELARELA